MIFNNAVKKLLTGHKIKHKKWPADRYIYFNKSNDPDEPSHFLIHFEDGKEIPYSHKYGTKPDENIWKIY